MLRMKSRRLQTFLVGASRFGIFADEVITIAEWRAPAPLPYAPHSVLGVVSIQGRMLTVLDLAELLHLPERDHNPLYILAMRGDEQLALAIDEKDEVIEFEDKEVDVNDGLIARVIRHEDGEIRVLNIQELFSSAIQGRERRRRRF